jgi:hypothetical protein
MMQSRKSCHVGTYRRHLPIRHTTATSCISGPLTHVFATSMLPPPVVPKATKQGVWLAAIGPEQCCVGYDTILLLLPNVPRACSELC